MGIAQRSRSVSFRIALLFNFPHPHPATSPGGCVERVGVLIHFWFPCSVVSALALHTRA